MKKDIEFLYLVGKNIKRIRQSKKPKLTMEKMGSGIGLSKQQIHRIENGHNITLKTIYKISTALQIEPHKIIAECDK